MKDNVLELKRKEIALQIIDLVQKISTKVNFAIFNQLLRSGTSIGANIAESTYAASKADFIYRLQIAQKEASETKYWLKLLLESKIIDCKYKSLYKQVLEIIKILAKSIVTAKQSD